MTFKRSIIILLFLPSVFFAQSKIDSLTRVLANAKQDTDKIKTLVLLALQSGSNDPEKAHAYASRAVEICEKPGYDTSTYSAKNCMGAAYRNQGVASYFLGNYTTALVKFDKAQRLFKEVKNLPGLASIYGWIGNTYYSKGDFEKALEAMLSALKLQEETGNKTGTAGALNGIANIYHIQANLKKALEYYFMSLKIRLTTDDSISAAYTYNNLGLVYMQADSLDKALIYHFKCLHLVEKYHDKKGMENAYGNIGEIYAYQKKYTNALAYQLKSLKISEEISDKIGISASYSGIGKIYVKMNDLRKALSCFEKGLVPAKESGNKEGMKDCYHELATTQYALGNFEQAMFNFEQYSLIKDSLMNQSNVENIEEMQTRFDTEKKEQEIQLLQKDQNIRELQLSQQQADINRQRIVIYSFIGGFLLILGLVFFIWKSYRQKKKINVGLERKNIEIGVQKKEIEEKNSFITDSIDYARTIQNAILPTDEAIARHFPGSFILFQPKDIVSGDFYWMNANRPDQLLFAAVDCTGHGVPGAFMSVMAFNMLENIVAEKPHLPPAGILNELNQAVLDDLHQESETSSAKYGMDISLLALDRKNGKLQFAGAHNSLLIVKNETAFVAKEIPKTEGGEAARGAASERKLIALKADNATIGMAREKFTSYTVDVQEGDMLYMFTDGYPDQKGGPQNKKFFASEFKKVLVTLAHKDPAQQKEDLLKTLAEWKGNTEQIDDILVTGIRV